VYPETVTVQNAGTVVVVDGSGSVVGVADVVSVVWLGVVVEGVVTGVVPTTVVEGALGFEVVVDGAPALGVVGEVGGGSAPAETFTLGPELELAPAMAPPTKSIAVRASPVNVHSMFRRIAAVAFPSGSVSVPVWCSATSKVAVDDADPEGERKSGLPDAGALQQDFGCRAQRLEVLLVCAPPGL
jgi:hypothetical protein